MASSARIAVGCDHAGFELKEAVKSFLEDDPFDIEDCGTHGKASVDYTEFGARVAQKVASGDYEKGILICGTGLGMSMIANRFPGVRAALCNDLFSAIMSRRHNDANILIMGGRVVGTDLAREILRAWLETSFEGGRHKERIVNIDARAKTALEK
ncbi:MAG: ribose 5-phosphate isomerase B [Desulfobacterales bacterium]|nr:ribose 5-phosphate isomerase B [Desulfobacterales bacterium]